MNKLAKSLVLLLITVPLGVGIAPRALAHADVVSTVPTADATVDAPLKEISITLSEAPLLEASAITVVNQDGSAVATAATKLSGTKLYIPWPADIAIGDVTVNYRVGTDDGHVVDSSFSFTYTAAAVTDMPATSPSGQPTDQVTAMASAVATDMPTVIATAMPATTSVDELGEQPESKTWIYVGLISFVIIAGGLLFLRRNK